MKNIEIKVSIRSLESVHKFLINLPEIQEVWLREQTDTYFNVPNGRLKLRMESGADSQLIYYNRSDLPQARESNYRIYYANNSENLKGLLQDALGIKVVVKKQRRLLKFRNVRIHLDSVSGLGKYLELESVVDSKTDEQAAEKNLRELHNILLSCFKLTPVSQSYSDLLIKNRKVGKL